VPLKAPPGPTVLPTQSTTPAAGESTPPAATPTASSGAWAAPGRFL
jgi:hypothetical protein